MSVSPEELGARRSSRLLVWGCGGHAKVVLETAAATGLYGTVLFVDDDPEKAGTTLMGVPVIGVLASLVRHHSDEVIVAIGDNDVRARAYAECKAAGFRVAKLIHPRAVVSPSARIEEGTLVMPLAAVNADAHVGRNCIVNTGAIVEHDCVVGDNAHLSPGVTLGGNVHIGAFAHIGLGARALPGVRIGASTTVGAGAVVVRNLPEGVVAVGVPARIRRYQRRTFSPDNAQKSA